MSDEAVVMTALSCKAVCHMQEGGWMKLDKRRYKLMHLRLIGYDFD